MVCTLGLIWTLARSSHGALLFLAGGGLLVAARADRCVSLTFRSPGLWPIPGARGGVRVVVGGAGGNAARRGRVGVDHRSGTPRGEGLLFGRGCSVLQFQLALLNAGLTLAGVLLGAPFRIFAIATGVAMSVVIGYLAFLVAAMREVQVPMRALAAVIAPTLASAAIMACGVAELRALLPADLHAAVTLLLAAGAGVLLYAGAMRVLAPETAAAAIVLFRRPGQPVVE